MTVCSKCGVKNQDDAKFCVNCGSSLSLVERVERHGDTCFGRQERPMRDECFGLPHGGAIAAMVFGLLIILLGLMNLFGWKIDIGAFVMIIFGALLVAGAIYGLTRRRS